MDVVRIDLLFREREREREERERERERREREEKQKLSNCVTELRNKCAEREHFSTRHKAILKLSHYLYTKTLEKTSQ